MSILHTTNIPISFSKNYLKLDNQNFIPWSDIEEVNTTIPIEERYLGLTVLIENEEYWYKDDLDDISLVLKNVSSGGGSGWELTGNAGTNPSTNFIGTTDDADIVFKRNNIQIARLSVNNFFVGQNAGSSATNAGNSNFLGFGAGDSATNAYSSNFLGFYAGYNSTSADNSNFLGNTAGYNSTSANNSNFLGSSAGRNATDANNSNFLGNTAGYNATDANNSNFLGPEAGRGATNANNSNFLGPGAGRGATNANYSNFLGYNVGYEATDANNSNFLGSSAGYKATDASHSNFLGFNVGSTFSGNNVGSNNIIIGTNISLPNATANSINLGGVLFGTGTYATTTGDPSIVPTATGRIGIGVVTPTAVLHLRASTTVDAVLRLTVGPAPTSPNDGDIWLESNTNTGLKIRLNSTTYTISLI